MSEFVEEDIEGLLPVFETLKGIQLLSPTEIDALVKRCQFFEYRLQKAVIIFRSIYFDTVLRLISNVRRVVQATQKDASSFKTYADYLESVLKLVRMRRKRIKYRLRENEIEGKIKIKIANLLRQCCERFKGRLELWLDLIEFLKNEKMYLRCSKAYFRAMQIFPRNSSLRIQAARFEYSVEHRIECARCLMQEGVRLDPTESSLWASFVQLELDYVKWLITRKSVLTGKGFNFPCAEEKELQVADEAQKSPETNTAIEGKNEQDAILGLKIVEMIIKQGLECCASEKSAMLLTFWRITKKYGLLARHLEQKLYNMLWSPMYKSEESWIAKSETTNYDQDSLYELLDEACADMPTEKMHRHYLALCQRHYSYNHDPNARAKCSEHLFWLINRGFGTDADVKKLNRIVDDFEEKAKVLCDALKSNPENPFLWMMLMQCKMKVNPTDVKGIRELFTKATQEASDEIEGIVDMYKVAINWAHRYSEDDVDEFFRQATFRTSPKVACEMRCVRLNYLAVVYRDRPDKLREEYFLFVKHPPNSIEVHRSFIKHELKSDDMSLTLISQALELMVVEFGNRTHECWLDYADFMLHCEPTTLQTIHRVTSLPPSEIEPFLVAYSNLLQNAAGKFVGIDSDMKKNVEVDGFDSDTENDTEDLHDEFNTNMRKNDIYGTDDEGDNIPDI
uniref:U3 small nucleolar RNA-associated protein 6 homolog C-terminal domain-containing protein n=1 Tax=Setaria digitata TaxID=48799 RepID=A0A915PR14_9BILA